MDPFQRRSSSERAAPLPSEASAPSQVRKTHSRARTPKSYQICDGVTAGLICFMVVFTPWAFGTTQEWSIWTMNIAGFVLGGLLLGKWWIRRQAGYKPARWNGRNDSQEEGLPSFDEERRDPWALGLALLTGLILAYTLVSALNARADYIEWERRFAYRDCIRWLPHSYDQASTFQAFWMYLGLACFFWATRDWLLGKSGKERRMARETRHKSAEFGVIASASLEAAMHSSRRQELPSRLKLLLWVLCINGAGLALEAILQRLSGTNRLLWLVEPRLNSEAVLQFGPYAYRANAATYFNLIWPVCLGFWLVLRHSAKPSLRSGHRVGAGQHLVLLPGAVLMAACPIVSTSRGGALVAVGMILIILVMLFRWTRKETLWFKVGVGSLFLIILGFSAFLALKQLAPRFQTLFTDQMSRRTEIYENALPIARDFPVFGTGPGAFGALYQLYRSDPTQDWAAYVHDDWLETRITFGWVGFGIILLILTVILGRWWFANGISAKWEFTAMLWVALGGGLLHAKFDFPLQIYSILFALVLLCAILFCLARPKES